ncbi:MAG: diguanylate cyclase [Nitrosomonadales bacterium]|nr:diguanylate cyclase [Nitrosomonadales bacterium]
MKFATYISAYWRGSIRRQLILGFALASFGLMLGFGYLVLKQQREELHRFSNERATEMSHTLSISGTSWALANDLVGLQEVVQGVARTPDLRRAYFLDKHGEVLASTNPDEVGFFVTDEISRKMMAANTRDQLVLLDNAEVIVVAHPVMAEGRQLGWSRVEMSRNMVNASLEALTRMWLLFLLFAVLAVSLVALVLARRLTAGLDHLMQVASAVERGWGKRRADVGRQDEIGVLARHLDRMLNAIEEQKKQISESEAKYRFLADNISDVIWIANLRTHRWEYMSPSVKKLLGYSVDEILEQPMRYTLSPRSYEDIQGWIEERSKLFLEGKDGSHVYTDEVEQFCSNGLPVWTEVTTHFARNEHGDLILLGVTRDIGERKKAEEQIRNLAFYDTLTQLPNRRLLLDRFNQVISACKRSNRYAALMFMDLDNFKPLNDEHGHDVGDLLLIEVARRITSCVREVDTVARFGGDEFVVMLSELDTDRERSLAQAGVVAEKIRQILGEPYRLTVLQEGGIEPRIVEHRCTASMGVALFNNHGVTQEDLLKLADAAMYQAKAAGRNQVRFAEA